MTESEIVELARAQVKSYEIGCGELTENYQISKLLLTLLDERDKLRESLRGLSQFLSSYIFDEKEREYE